MVTEVQALVVGGGPSGLAVAYSLQGDTLVLEKEGAVGGLCRSIYHDGAVFDIGGHSFHTPHPEVHELVESLLDGGLYHQQRDAKVYSHHTLIPYPFQRFFDRLPDPAVVRECTEGLEHASGDTARAANLEEYLLAKFGRGIARHFMLPYNRKLWARDIRQISCEWTPERVAAANFEHERFDHNSGQRKPLQPDTQVGYPRQGGFEEIYRSFIPHIPALELNSPIARIDPRGRMAVGPDGRQYRWEFLVSTIPLPVLVRMVDGAPAAIIAMSDRLEYMSLRVELLLAGRRLGPTQRIYVADSDVPPHKIAFNHNSSPSLRAKPQHAIMAEVSLSDDKPVDVNQIAPRTIAFLCDLGVLESPRDIVWQGHVDVKYAYPVYTHHRPALVQGIKDWLAQHHIYTVGRFGDWEYVNSDRCVMKGMDLGRALRQQYPVRGR
ncbi:MAG: FAD-dependent oxidoreductase [Phycisphaeraceae bacterium]|nr:FAD-dependent oxidoreductase [Phycisphaeraceae bacterium]